MSTNSPPGSSGAIGKSERITQNRVVDLFQHQPGYTYLGNLEDKSDNSNIDEELLTSYLRKQYFTGQINRAYIVVHEMTHLLEPGHNDRFVALMDEFMPKWRFYKDELNRLPVRHESWGY